ncbi:unnamed protein product [Spodoptera littoralis]|uniref:C2H2-type domain-containing protein n=1 Tax=Spodoptera littoralis TaxID=7109 RepID=A0A9P0I1Y2_SPOLI|nr:unnamed protein product [Spodoptera littoralis]CAH1638294.1 unnamed protein product [Spodoptera littoralis]
MNTKKEFNCLFCKDTFDNKEDLQEHFRKHGDPQYKKRFEIPVQGADQKSKDKTELVTCDVCSQVFPTISKAITHKHKVHPDHDAKYFCPWCGKLFTLKHLYNVHVRTTHGGEEESTDEKRFHCDCCNVDFFIASAMLNHNKFFHRSDTDMPDIGQSKKIKTYSQVIIPLYYCPFCGEEYENKVNLFKHMTDEHGDENQSPDEVLKCPACDAVFYHLDAYEIHLTFHTTDDMYSIYNPAFMELLDFSLETVPPIIEKVENLNDNPDTDDPESTMNAVGIEKFLELAMDHADEEESSPVKPKKHKKHKKSKKSAITLDEFLSMNQDVFGEGLDFQGIEEVPTRVVKKQLKNNMKMTNNATTSAELDKLKKAGIVVKRKIAHRPIVKNFKVATSTPINTANKPVPKLNQIREIETSSEVLNKLINQSNNQIKIVKKINPAATMEPEETIQNAVEEPETPEDINKISSNDIEMDSTKTDTDSTKETRNTEETPVTVPDTQSEANKVSDSVSDTDLDKETDNRVVPDSKETPQQIISKVTKLDYSQKTTNNVTKETENTHEPDHEEIEKYHSDHSDAEFDDAEHASDLDNHMEDDKAIDDCQTNIDNDTTLSASSSSLSTLKRLSHLITVKPISQNKNSTLTEPKAEIITETNITKATENINKKEASDSPVDTVHVNKPKTVEKDPTLDALKTLSKNITVKSVATKRNIDAYESENDEIVQDDKNTSGLQSKDVSSNKNITIKKSKLETNEPKPGKIVNHQERRYVLGQHMAKSPAGQIPKMKVEKDNAQPNSNAQILKRLTNITTKPVINKNKSLSANMKQTNVPKKVVVPQKPEEIIEIFDVDDSEDEEENSRNQPQPTQSSPGSTKSMDALKNLSKNITVKPLNQAPTSRNIKVENNIKIEKEDNSSQHKFKDESNNDSNMSMKNKNMAVKNILQGISKNITIKSRNTSPSQFAKSQENSQDSKVTEDDYASDSDSNPGTVQITELDEDMELDDCDENHHEKIEEMNETVNNPIIESPKESCSENEDDDIHDFEQDIRVNTMQKSQQTINSTVNSVCLNNLKSINKNLTIKSLSKTSMDNDEDSKTHIHSQDSQETTQAQKKQQPTKSNQIIKKEFQNDNVAINRVSKNDHSSAFLKKVSSMNTVNKEVTVKTIQTKTMIQEITTTVTKTIKTVNQTMKQEVRNSVQTNSPMQRIQGMRPAGPKNLQGVVIRHATPITKTSNTVSQIRPNNATRNFNQNVAIRSPTPINIARPINPRMMIGKKVTSSPSPHKPIIARPSSPSTNKPIIGKPLKISPSAVIKRPVTEEVSGPFSCFKKPKESLIPVSDIPAFNNSSEGTVQYTSASQSSSSNFTSSTKLVKGNSIVTAKQMKSEVNSSSQQISRLSNVSGLKITASQQRQSQVPENSESSGMKRTTLEAIQRLQKQGLLVKKPRVDVHEGPEDSDHDSDHNVGHSSADEHDE